MKPKFDVLCAYIEEKGYSLEPGKFYDYYESKDWKANGKDIINWKALVDTWAKNKSRNEEKTEEEKGKEEEFEMADYSFYHWALFSDIYSEYYAIDPSAGFDIPKVFMDTYSKNYIKKNRTFIYRNREVKVNLERELY